MLPFLPYTFGNEAAQTVVAAAPSKSYVYSGGANSSASGTTISASIDIGDASSDRLVVVAIYNLLSASTPSDVDVGGTTLSQIEIQNGTGQAAIYAGMVPTGSGSQTISETWTGSAYLNRSISVWTLRGFSSATPKDHGGFLRSSGTGGPATISVAAGDFLLCAAHSGGNGNFSASTEAPTEQTLTVYDVPADKTITSTSASFSLAHSMSNGAVAYVLYSGS